MITVEQIIKKAKRSTNTEELGAISDFLCVDYLNRIQSYIEDTLFLVNDENDLFLKDYNFNLIRGQDNYSLPIDIYAKSSIDTVAVSFLNGLSQTFLPLKKVSRKQRGFTFGYFVQENEVIFTPKPQSPLAIKLTYQRKLPLLSLKCGTVTNVLGNVVTLSGTLADFDKENDYVSVSLAVSGRKIVSLVGNTLTLDNASGIVNGDVILSGKYSTNVSELPDEIEKYLIIALERMISYRQSSVDFKVNSLLTSEEIEIIKEVFADNSYDDAKPPVTEWQEWLP